MPSCSGLFYWYAAHLFLPRYLIIWLSLKSLIITFPHAASRQFQTKSSSGWMNISAVSGGRNWHESWSKFSFDEVLWLAGNPCGQFCVFLAHPGEDRARVCLFWCWDWHLEWAEGNSGADVGSSSASGWKHWKQLLQVHAVLHDVCYSVVDGVGARGTLPFIVEGELIQYAPLEVEISILIWLHAISSIWRLPAVKFWNFDQGLWL